MKVIGCVISILGVLLCILSFALFGFVISRVIEARDVRTFPLRIGENLESEVIEVDASKFCMIAVKGTVSSDHAKLETGKDQDYDLKYAFPFGYSVLDSNGKTLMTEDTSFADNVGVRSYSNERVTRDGGEVAVKADYAKFEPPANGEIRIEAVLQSDEVYEAEIENLELIVYDRVSKHGKSVTAGVLLMVLGGVLAFVGLVLFIVSTMQQKKASPPPYPPNPAA